MKLRRVYVVIYELIPYEGLLFTSEKRHATAYSKSHPGTVVVTIEEALLAAYEAGRARELETEDM